MLIRGSGRIDNIQLLDALPTSSVYEDAEDGLIENWDVYDQTPAGATISNVFDQEKQSQVIELSGDITRNGYRFGYHRSTNARSWGNTEQTIVQWDGRFNEHHIIYVGVETTNGFRYLRYQSSNTEELGLSGTQARFGIGLDKRDGNWYTMTRDMQADLNRYEPNNEILEVNGMLVRGSGRIDNIQLLDGATAAETTVHFYINDHLSTPQQLLNDNGDVSWEATYEAFGKATITTEEVVQNHRFPGQYFDVESGLYYNWNRYYDAEVGRYVTSDPIGLQGGLNTFGYAFANPIMNFDLNGLEVQMCMSRTPTPSPYDCAEDSVDVCQCILCCASSFHPVMQSACNAGCAHRFGATCVSSPRPSTDT